jgi:quinoprotein glucose dehydrogenase
MLSPSLRLCELPPYSDEGITMETRRSTLSFGWKNLCSLVGITGIVVALIGLALLVLGVKLISLGGSWYYAPAGLGLVVSGWWIVLRRRSGLTLYGLVLLATVAWALWEVGLDGWQLMPRLLAPAVVGIWLCMPWIAGKLVLAGGNPAVPTYRNAGAGAIACLLLAVCVVGAGYRTSALRHVQYGEVAEATAPVPAPNPPVGDGDWLYYGRTADGDRYSPLAQITPQNVSALKVAWKFQTGDLPSKAETEKGREFSFEDTPTKVGNTLYVCTPHHKIFSLDATTGKENWEFDPHAHTASNIFITCRGVAYYAAPASVVPQGKACQRRILTPTGEASMMALDADTGKLCDDFGNHGTVSLTDHMGEVPPGFHYITSQPLVVGDRVILGGWIYDDQAWGEPSGVIRAYNPVTGALAWAWDLGKADPTAPLKPGEIYTRSTPNAWGTYTADPALGMVYLPMGNATPDYFGGQRRPFDDTYASAIVALDIETGKERWRFQTVHHDLWDFDLPVGPSLVDLKTPQGIVPALVQDTKRGDFFVLDRRNGHPLSPIVEKPVPQEHVPGERLSATQPYQPDYPSVAPEDIKESDAWGATPIDQLLCRIDFKERKYYGKFTAPQEGKYLAYPAFDGVIDWYGSSIDPARKLLIANSSYMPMQMDFLLQKTALETGVEKPWKGWGKEPYPNLINVSNNPEYGTPYAIVIKPWLNALGVPCMAPPWGKLTAIDLQSRKIVWQRPLGTTGEMGPFNSHVDVPLPTGMVGMGGSIVTASGVVFIASTADDEMRAFDEKTGKELWSYHLPAGGNATPLTYSGADGRQYVVIAAGGHGGLRTIAGDYVIAYALPKDDAD